MTWSQAFATLMATFAISIVVGIVLRCLQERFRLITWPLAILFFASILIIGAVAPIYLVYKTLIDESKSFHKRLFFSLFIIPAGYVYAIGGIGHIAEITVWKAMREVHNFLDQPKMVTVSFRLRLPRYSRSIFDVTSKGIFEAIDSKLKIS